jgi:hypothetical protein
MARVLDSRLQVAIFFNCILNDVAIFSEAMPEL